MNDVVLPKSVFEILVKHLVDMEEEKGQLLEKYYPDATKEREDFQYFINNYIQKLEAYIASVSVENATTKSCPFVIIGSIVEIEDLQCNEVEKYQIVSPFEGISNPHIDIASYLSPMGKALLLKKIKDEVTINTPMGQFTYMIKSIEIPNPLASTVRQ